MIEGEAYEVRRPGRIRIGWGAILWWSIYVGGFTLAAAHSTDPFEIAIYVFFAGLAEPIRRAQVWAYRSLKYQVPGADADRLRDRISPLRRKVGPG